MPQRCGARADPKGSANHVLQARRCVGRRKLEQVPRVRPGYPGSKRHRLEEVPALPMRSRTVSEGREADSRSSCRSQAPRFPHGPEGPRRPEGLGKNRRVPVLQRKPQGPAASAYAGRMDGEVRKGRRCHEHRVRIEDARASRGAHALPGHAERERRAAGGGHRRQPVGAGGGHPLLRRQRHPALPHRLGRHPVRVEPGEPPGLGACVRGAARGHRGAGRPEPGAAQACTQGSTRC